MLKIEIKKSKKQFYFHIKAENGNILCHSETYTRKLNCIKTARRLLNTPKYKLVDLCQ